VLRFGSEGECCDGVGVCCALERFERAEMRWEALLSEWVSG
jgi:hypothetical protein